MFLFNRQDLNGEKDFYQVLKELNIDTNYSDEDGSDIEVDDDISVETRNYASSRSNYDEDEII